MTAVSDNGGLNLKAKMRSELAGGIKLVKAAGELESDRTSTSFNVGANKLILKSQRDLGNIDIAAMSSIAPNMEISVGADVVLNAPLNSNSLVVTSTGYFDADGTLKGGSLRTNGAALTSENITLNALKDIDVEISGQNTTLIAGVADGCNININATGSNLTAVTARGKQINITADTMNADDVQGDKVSLTANTLNNVIATGTEINITANGTITTSNTGITANFLSVNGTGNIGSEGNVVQTAVSQLNVSDTGGNAYIHNQGEMMASSINLSGSLYLENVGALTMG
ncbi:hypothetical protein [Umezakia ovalisporum]|jgi:hypothetical protein|uniref:Uncharacterized protein n=1 Tax=Umezakia ovalisporum FSS-43 TaxID=2740520 RepID=A0ABT6K6H0_9CYAN|nr:hypothetical protein [Umezakia ovalisporum]MBI1243020.1 hypothetical protein [Nostoc sp. RI_552]MDH6057933.1 hypothetical protein [Umezakia ovalisporum FSS-43]MDH6066854.1 hypothetical protein [Umezakia ovalisporum APH033B]MDH6071957.1 hypothetical protein [Umezakia ovalisporum CobakiLakeA]MDH6073327.1 hypothetical protein [Umezakia ovalisporum CS-1034]